jgi:pSer/pThr/pTyr-binding forkhead associated (FHA) protein
MVELWLKYNDPTGSERRVLVDKDKFAVGRHSENDLSIADGRLSRGHVLIERFGDVFVLTDRRSSNGTELNGERLSEPKPLKNGDHLSLGGLEFELELVTDDVAAPPAESTPEPPTPSPQTQTQVSAGTGGFPTSFFVIAPIIAVVILAVIGIVIYTSGGKTQSVDNSNFVYSSNDLDDPPKNRRDKNSSTTSGANEVVTSNPTPGSSNDVTNPTPATDLTGTGKTEQNAAAFLRKAAQNDPKAFITGEQAKIVDSKIKSLSGSSALAGNINSARRNAAQIKALATSKNLKPQFLAVAAITKLGNSGGDVLQTSQSIADVLDRLGTQIGSELGDDCLLMVAAYDQGAAGDFMKMRNMLQDLATKTPESSRALRTIWFLKKNGKITDAEYDLALRFLATGTITQNPKDYGVNAEPLIF